MTDNSTAVAADSATVSAADNNAAPSSEQTQNALAATQSEGEGQQEAENSQSSDGKAEADKSATGKPSPEQRKATGQYIRELKQKLRESDAKAALYREQLDRLGKPVQPRADATVEEIDDIRLQNTVRKVSAEQTQQNMELTERQAAQARADTFKAICDDASDRMPDLFEKFGKLPCTAEMGAEILDSDKAAELAMYFVNNPREARSISELPPSRQGAAIARIEARLQTALDVRKTSNTPPPTGTLKGAGAPAGFNLATASVDDVAAQLKKAGVIR